MKTNVRGAGADDRVMTGSLQQSVRQIWKAGAMMSRWNATNQCQPYDSVDLSAESETVTKSCLRKSTKLTDQCFKQPQCHPGSPSKTQDDRN